jgi:DNA modification methylase
MKYQDFLSTKKVTDKPTGKPCQPSDVHEKLFDFQRLIVAWAVKRGRAAIFADCGLGKTLMQLEWARLVGGRCLVLTPLAVSSQTIREAAKIGLVAKYAHDQIEATEAITVTNYERLDKFDAGKFDSVVLDESSILKSFDGKTRTTLIEKFANTPYRLCCTATPAPNDHAELANHSEFLGVMTRTEMLATFFVHDEQHWRMKGHAADAFWRWLVSWAVCIRNPSDIGCDDTRFKLPKLNIRQVEVVTTFRQEGMLFGHDVAGIQGRIQARRNTIDARVTAAARLCAESKEQWLIWCGMNRESELLTKTISDAVEVKGSDDAEDKEARLLGFVDGSNRVLVTKPSIAGFGMNFQNCHNVVFVGLSDSYEEYYQAVRRCWRFGQKREVNVWLVTADVEQVVVSNIKQKEQEAAKMQDAMVEQMRDLETEQVKGQKREKTVYVRDVERGEGWQMNLGDTCELTPEMADNSIDFSICSPPFASLYTYTNTERDMGNCKDAETFFSHYKFLLSHWLRVTKPGRLAAVHVSQIPAMLSRDGYIGLKDFRGEVVRAHTDAGWIFHGEICVDKNPQAQAIRTKAKGLTFTQLEKDAAWMRPALADFILLFRKDGENQVPVKPDVNREQWIEYAHPCWYGIRETNTLNVAEARDEKDERHICPLQLDLIDRAIRLWSNKGELVFSPFAGIGSEGYQSLLNGRRFVGNELKANYWKIACENLRRAHAKRTEGLLFPEAA